MSILKRLLLLGAKLTFQFSVVVWIIVTALVLVFASPEPSKETLKKANFYTEFSNSAVEQVAHRQELSKFGQIDDETLRSIAKEVFTPQKFQEETEEFIDALYAWLEGRTSDLKFTIDNSDARKAIAASLAKQKVESFGRLRECSFSDTQASVEQGLCRPPGVDLKAQQKTIEEQILANNDFLPDVVINPDNLEEQSQGEPLLIINPELPKNFQVFKSLPVYIAFFAIILALAVVFMSKTKGKGVLSVARSLLVSGVSVLLIVGLFSLILSRSSEQLASGLVSQGSLDPTNVLLELAGAISLALIKVSLIILILGVGIIVARYFHGRQTGNPKPNNGSTSLLS